MNDVMIIGWLGFDKIVVGLWNSNMGLQDRNQGRWCGDVLPTPKGGGFCRQQQPPCVHGLPLPLTV